MPTTTTTLRESLESRIQSLRSVIEAQQTQLAAYEHVLALESGKKLASLRVPAKAAAAKNNGHKTTAVAAVHTTPTELTFKGNKTKFAAELVKQRGGEGVNAEEMEQAFAAHNVPITRKRIYNIVSLLSKQKKIGKRGGRYYTKKAAAAGATATPRKHRISPEGMKRIIAATKKRWAAHRAAQKRAAK